LECLLRHCAQPNEDNSSFWKKGLEAAIGIEPMNKGFADLCLTTWLRRLLKIRDERVIFRDIFRLKSQWDLMICPETSAYAPISPRFRQDPETGDFASILAKGNMQDAHK
jgi:hypothetical protein